MKHSILMFVRVTVGALGTVTYYWGYKYAPLGEVMLI